MRRAGGGLVRSTRGSPENDAQRTFPSACEWLSRQAKCAAAKRMHARATFGDVTADAPDLRRPEQVLEELVLAEEVVAVEKLSVGGGASAAFAPPPGAAPPAYVPPANLVAILQSHRERMARSQHLGAISGAAMQAHVRARPRSGLCAQLTLPVRSAPSTGPSQQRDGARCLHHCLHGLLQA